MDSCLSQRKFAQNEIQLSSSGIWTEATDSIVFEDNCYDNWEQVEEYVGCPRGVTVKAVVCRIVVSEFELQSRYYVVFWINTLGKGVNPLIRPAMGWILHYCSSRRMDLALITQVNLYAIEQQNKQASKYTQETWCLLSKTTYIYIIKCIHEALFCMHL